MPRVKTKTTGELLYKVIDIVDVDVEIVNRVEV